MITRVLWNGSTAPALRGGARIFAACGVMLLAHACGGSQPPSRRPIAPESCPDAEALPSCEARLDSLSASLADALAPAAQQPAGQAQASTDQMDQLTAEGAPAQDQDEDADEDAEEHADERPHFAQDRRALSHGPDCTAARELRDRICDLSDAICALAARDGAPHEIMDKCTAARTSCERARSEVSNACPKP